MKKFLASALILTAIISIGFLNVRFAKAANCPQNFQEVGGGCACVYDGQVYTESEAQSAVCKSSSGNDSTGGVKPGDPSDGGVKPGDPKPPTGPASLSNPLAVGSICELISALLNVVTEIGAIIAVMFIIWSGFLFIKAQGNPEEIKTAKRAFYYTILGTAILLGSSVLAKIIITTIGAITKNSGNSIC